MPVPEPLGGEEIARRLARMDGWQRQGDEITKTFKLAYHECLHLAMYVGAKAREIGHHPDIDIRWQLIRFGITTHDADHQITAMDFDLAAHIDRIAAAHGAEPVT
jgi:4a-hydroxytetrahydrobiopterin dehydratase